MLRHLSLVELADVEPRIRTADCEVICGPSALQRVGVSTLGVAQGSAVPPIKLSCQKIGSEFNQASRLKYEFSDI